MRGSVCRIVRMRPGNDITAICIIKAGDFPAFIILNRGGLDHKIIFVRGRIVYCCADEAYKNAEESISSARLSLQPLFLKNMGSPIEFVF